jgi:hydroxymethylbilane synthase
LGIEVRAGDDDLREMLSYLDHAPTRREVSAERAFLKRLGGGCQLPIAAYAKGLGSDIVLRGFLGNPDGSRVLVEEIKGPAADGEPLGVEMAERLLSRGGHDILAELYRTF